MKKEVPARLDHPLGALPGVQGAALPLAVSESL